MDKPVTPAGGVILADAPVEPPPPIPVIPPVQPGVSSVPAQQFQVAPPPSPPAPAVSPPNIPTDIPAYPAAPPPVPPSIQDTVVVPSAGDPNPFIPQGAEVANPQMVIPPPPPAASGAGTFFRRFLLFLLIIAFLGGIALGGRYIYGMLAGAKEVTITYWGLWENDAIVRPLIAEFEAQNPKIKVQYVKQNHRQYRERLQAAIERGDGPDVFRFHNTWVPMLKDVLAPVPASVMSPAQFSTVYYPVAGRDLVAGDTIFGLPMMIDGLGLYYNEDLFAAAGVLPPTTYEELLGIVPKLTVNSEGQILTSAIALGTTGNIENYSDIVATMMMQNGAILTTPTGVEAEQTLIFYRKFADPSDPMYTWNDSLDNSIVAFANGRVAMIMAPSWRAFDVKQINPNLRFKIAPIPQLPGTPRSWASYWVEGVSMKTNNKEQAMTFLQYLTSKETMTKMYTEAGKTRLFGEPYARVDMADALKDDPFVGAYILQAEYARSFPLASRTFDNGINDKMVKYLEDAINAVSRGSSPKEALQTAANGFRQILGSYGLATGSAPAGQ